MSGQGEPSSDSFQVIKSGFQWVIKKEVFTGDKDHLDSTYFNLGFEEQTNWFLTLEPRLPSNDNITWVCVSLFTGSKPVSPIRTKFRVGLVTNDDKEVNVKYGSYAFDSIGKGWGWENFIQLDSLLAQENNFFKNDKLTIFCDLEVYRSVEVAESSLVRGQSQMLQTGEFSDFTLVVEGEELKVHRCVLSTRSPVFRAMFQHDMIEKHSCRVEIEELDIVGVKGLLEFLYTGKVTELEKIAKNLLPAADRYGVEELKILCEQVLCYGLCPENVAELLEFAELHTATKLKEHALTFIYENSTEVIKESSFWQLNGSNLFKEVMCTLVNKAQSGKPLTKRIKLSSYEERNLNMTV